MLVKAIMNRTSLKFFENERIEDVCTFFLESKESGGIVYNHYGTCLGVFTSLDVFKGYKQEKQYLREVIRENYQLLHETDNVLTLDFGTFTINPVCDVEGDILGYITEQAYLKALSEKAQLQIKYYDAIFDSAHNGILSIDADGSITSINPPALKMAKTTKAKSVGSFLSDVVLPTGLLDVVRTGKGHTEKYQAGNRIYISNRSPIIENGKVIGAVGVFQDISEIEFISNELETVKKIVNELDTVIESSSDGICVVRNECTVSRMNRRFKEMLKVSGNITEAPIKLPEYITQLITEVINTKQEKSLLKKGMETDNSLIILGTPILNNVSEVDQVVINIKDMTEMERMQDELAEAKKILNELNLTKFPEFIYKAQSMKRLVGTVEQVAKVDATVLLTGESGVGKGEIANLIKKMSQRNDQPFVKVNCGAIPDTLIESELFGYVAGAFTGALSKGKKGYFELADGGTVFLDEIGEIPPSLQVKLLSVLQDREIARIGSEHTTKIDVRVIAATNKNLDEMVTKGSFREDLFYRLNVVPLLVPPLRERTDDIPLFIRFFSDLFEDKYNKKMFFTEGAIRAFMEYSWPGNVRELVNVLERAFIILHKKEIGYPEVKELLHMKTSYDEAGFDDVRVNEIMPMKQAVEKLEIQLIQKALNEVKSYRKAAQLLGVNVSTISRKMKKYEYEKDRHKDE